MSLRGETGAERHGTHRRFLGLICWQTGRDADNMRRFAAWFLLWTISHEGISYIQTNVAMSMTLAWALAFIPALFGAFAGLAYLRFLREADEMIRRIHLTGMAVGFGAGIFVWMGIQAPLGHDMPYKQMLFVLHLHKALVYMAMVFGWTVGQNYASRRYR